LDAFGVVPEAWANDTDVYSMRILDESDNVLLPTVDDISFLATFALDSADVLSALQTNTEDLVLNGSSLSGTALGNVTDDITLGASGSIDASAGAITLGTVTGATSFSSDITVASGDVIITSGFLNIGGGSSATIASGVITATRTSMIVDTESSASTDDLDTVSGTSNGDIITLQSTSDARVTTVKSGTGNIILAGGVSFALDSVNDRLLLLSNGTSLIELSRSSNN